MPEWLVQFAINHGDTVLTCCLAFAGLCFVYQLVMLIIEIKRWRKDNELNQNAERR